MSSNTAKINKELIQSSAKHVQDLMDNKLPEHIKFHTWGHTDFVIEQVQKIAGKSGCSDEEIEMLVLAATFHDIGYIATYDGHEAESIKIAEKFLTSQKYPAEKIATISKLITATRADKRPRTKLQKILVDADLAHLGKKNYTSVNEILREELNVVNQDLPEGTFYNSAEWTAENIKFISGHRYFTKAARSMYNKRKAKNYKALKKKNKKLEIQNSISKNKAAQIIFKTSLRNHIDLTSIADQKANIMLSINALILSLGMPLFARYLIDQPQLMKPAVLFLITSGVTMILATLATRPVKTDGKTNLENLHSGKSNLFFFGNFYKLKVEDYHEGIKKVLGSQKVLDESIVNDLYYLGNALGHKFAKLRICYTFFAVGLAVTFAAFVICYFWYR